MLVLAASPEDLRRQDTDEWWRERRLLARGLIDLGHSETAYRVVREAAPPANLQQALALFSLARGESSLCLSVLCEGLFSRKLSSVPSSRPSIRLPPRSQRRCTALRLSLYCGNSPEFWLNLQQDGLPGNLGDRAARLVVIPAGASPASRGGPVTAVVISSGGKGDRRAESLEVNAPDGWPDAVPVDCGSSSGK
jgi:hypothetical protein